MAVPVQRFSLHCPPLVEVATVLQSGLGENFAEVHVAVVDCPNLKEKPFMLAGQGLCGNPRLADVGGVPNLVPLPQLDRKYNLEEVAKQVDLPGGLVVGAGAGPCNTEGVNCEMMANIKTGADGFNNTHICKVNPKNGSHILKKPESTDFFLLGNFFISDGQPGKVLEIRAARRTGPENFMSCVRKSLQAHYGDKPVGVGGAFLLEQGRAKIHVMPAFSETPLQSDDDVNNWLRFYEMPGPLVCVGQLTSCDPDWDLRIEHFHCFSDHGDGGHYHYDTTPDEVKYLGYFNVGEYMYRIDRPTVTHQIGRD